MRWHRINRYLAITLIVLLVDVDKINGRSGFHHRRLLGFSADKVKDDRLKEKHIPVVWHRPFRPTCICSKCAQPPQFPLRALGVGTPGAPSIHSEQLLSRSLNRDRCLEAGSTIRHHVLQWHKQSISRSPFWLDRESLTCVRQDVREKRNWSLPHWSVDTQGSVHSGFRGAEAGIKLNRAH
ncbi:uncharacterized protein EI90DRAFT_804516 [Cantharellus anzutake]|uniref:uncharacterized protein n=1 Tax=Cantharellus anzutake TaxID=1750568 RepID=UPI00190742F0|nr:uncharacterized protein EI90DRAFT_804516 [Cantharellus anzutake]KAF8342921.1 hypothetical protein EI90DRAFT_804516 [Cantharellus anzutake]